MSEEKGNEKLEAAFEIDEESERKGIRVYFCAKASMTKT
jgi:hypothetical protein